MGIVALFYVIGMVFIASAGEVQTPFLVAADWALGILYVLAGSVTGWQRARK